jgi:hypothetical protein
MVVDVYGHWRRIMSNLGRAGALFAAVLIVGACIAPAASVETTSTPVASAAPSPTVAASAAPTASPVPTTFASTTYGYSLTVPAGWTSIQASVAWNGSGAPFSGDAEADQFNGPGTASAWAFAAPTTKDLAGYAQERIAATAAAASATCPAAPDLQDQIEIGGEPGTLLSWDCGILINIAVMVHNGAGYLFGFRDPAVHAATDAADRATFLDLLKSVRFPPGPTTYSSGLYGYSLTLPSGWEVVPALFPWDGTTDPGHLEPTVDRMVGPSVFVWAFAAPTTEELADYASARIAAEAEVHPCPKKAATTDKITIDGEPALLMARDCGILVLTAITIHDSLAYLFYLQDSSVHAATDPADEAIFADMLASVRLPK